jgi:hypothetical protein
MTASNSLNPTLFIREHEIDPNEPHKVGARERAYRAFPARDDYDQVAETGASLTVMDTPRRNAYAYPSHEEPYQEPSDRFTRTHEFQTNRTQETGRWDASGANRIMEIAEIDIRNTHKAYTDLTTDGPDGQMKLFGSDETAPRHVVDSMFSSKQARVHAPTLLAIAERDTQMAYGTGLEASTDRSKYSEQLTQHMGSLTGQKMTERTHEGDYTLNSDYGRSRPREDHLRGTHWGPKPQEIPAGEVATGRNTVRSLIKANKPAKPDKSEQLELPLVMNPRARKR